MRTMSAEVCTFQRERGDKSEQGIAIGHGLGDYDVEVILDLNFKPVPTPIYNYELAQNQGAFQFLVESIVPEQKYVADPRD